MVAKIVQSLGVLTTVGLVLAMLPGLYRGELFAWHPLFMGVGFLGFMTEGILTAVRFRPNEGMARVVAIQNHGLIQAGASVSVGLGFYAIYRNKALKGKQHFASLHGKTGLVATALTAASVLLGVLSFRKLGLIQRFPESWQPHIKWLHRMVSIGTWVQALVVMQIVLPHPAVFTGAWCRGWQAGVLATVVLMLYTVRRNWAVGSTQGPKHL
eukprot:scaffold6.g2879.t1